MQGGSPKAGFSQSTTEALLRLWVADEADRRRRAAQRDEYARRVRESLRARSRRVLGRGR